MTDKEKRFEDFIRGIQFDDTPDPSHRDKLEKDLLDALSNRPPRQIQIWRMIMNKPITKLAVAAAVLLIVASIVTILNYSVAPAYAIEQTIEAMRSIHSVHAYCTNWDNSPGEIWVQINPETGREEYYYADQGNFLIVGTPQATYYYYKDKNLVRIRSKYVPASEVRFSHFFEDLVNWVQQHHGELQFHFQFDEDLQQEVIRVHMCTLAQGNIGEKEYIFRIDPETKLPIDMEALKCDPDEGVKRIDSLEYNVTIPEGIFKFEIPEGAKIVPDEE